MIRSIERLPRIPKANQSTQAMRPQYLLTPLLFSLDPRLRFPIINGRGAVQNLLRRMKVKDSGLDIQLRVMVSLLGHAGINDAADLDLASQGNWLGNIYTGPDQKAQASRLTSKQTEGKNLSLKDEADHIAIQTGITQPKRRLHNKMTNQLMALLRHYVLLEGEHPAAKYDVLVKTYNGIDDLLIEVKSSMEEAHVRMAIGQLYAYSHHLRPHRKPHMAILLPSEPTTNVKDLLSWLNIGCIWFVNNNLQGLATCSSELKNLIQERTPS